MLLGFEPLKPTGYKKIFVQNKKEQNVIDIAEQWCDYDSYKTLKDHFDSVKPPKEKRGKPKPKPKAKPSGTVQAKGIQKFTYKI